MNRETTEDELERVEKERDEAVEALERIKRDINRYYGLDV